MKTRMKELGIAQALLLLSLTLFCCKNNQGPLTNASTNVDPNIKANQEKAYKILEKLILAEKVFAVKNGRYSDINELREKRFFKITDSELEDSGYTLKIKWDGVKELKIFMNPTEYKKTGIISFFADQTGTIRGGDHNGNNASPQDPETRW